MVFVFSMSSVNVVYYLPKEEIVKKKRKTDCALDGVRGYKRE
jgi:hypothetical protein